MRSRITKTVCLKSVDAYSFAGKELTSSCEILELAGNTKDHIEQNTIQRITLSYQ